MTRVGAALALLAVVLCVSTAAAQQAAPAPVAARDPANVFHWDTLALGPPPVASTAVEAQRPQASTPQALLCAELLCSCGMITCIGTRWLPAASTAADAQQSLARMPALGH